MNGVETTICWGKKNVGRIDQNMGRNDKKSVELTGCRNDRVPKRLGTNVANFK